MQKFRGSSPSTRSTELNEAWVKGYAVLQRCFERMILFQWLRKVNYILQSLLLVQMKDEQIKSLKNVVIYFEKHIHTLNGEINARNQLLHATGWIKRTKLPVSNGPFLLDDAKTAAAASIHWQTSTLFAVVDESYLKFAFSWTHYVTTLQWFALFLLLFSSSAF